MAHNARMHCGPIQSARRKVKYSAQKTITERNRKRKWLKHIRNFPNDSTYTGMKDLDPEIRQLVNKNFKDLIWK